MPTVVIKPGSTIFVTGVNGLIGAHIADQLLARGYNVRGAVRDVQKTSWLTEYFAANRKDAKFELVSVPDMTVEGCYDEVVKGTDGFIHVASPLGADDPNEAIPIGVNGGLNALRASAKESSIKRVVFTSSSIATTFPQTNVDYSVDETSYNEQAIQWAWNHPADQPEDLKRLFIYAGTKTETEKTLWKWLEENKPGFVFNAVLPNCNFGKILVPEKQGFPSTVEWGHIAFTGENIDFLAKRIAPQFFIDTVDDALLHVGALIYEEVKNERLFGFAQPFNWNDILRIYRKLYPNKNFHEDFEGLGEDRLKVPNQRAEEVLKWVKGSGWSSLEDSVKEMAKAYV